LSKDIQLHPKSQYRFWEVLRFSNDIYDSLKNQGHYDGISFYENFYDNTTWSDTDDYSLSYVVMNPNQIKLADGTNTTFDGNNSDIRFDLGGEIERYKEQGILELNFYPTNSEHAKEHNVNANNPLYIQNLLVKESDRLKHIGKKVLLYLDEYAKKNGHDVVFGYINQNAIMTKDNRTGYFTEFTDIDFIKHWLFRNGYNVNRERNDFHKVIASDSNDINNEYNPDIRYAEGGSVKKVKFDIESREGEEDRTTISINGIGEVVLTETFPEYEFLEDIGEDGLEELGVEEGDFIGKIEHIEIEDEYK
jgi:hypothetical protein